MEWGGWRDDAREWCQGKHWEWRAPLLAYLGYAGFRTLTNPEYSSLFSGITFGIHELGHVLMSFAGEFLMMAGGSLFQILAPIAAAFIFLRQRDYFGITVAFSWLSLSLFELARYIGDSRAQQLPLLGLTSDPQHDWHYLLSKLGMLESDLFLAGFTRVVGTMIFTASLLAGVWLCLQMNQFSRFRKRA
jgi:hypothetical protein